MQPKDVMDNLRQFPAPPVMVRALIIAGLKEVKLYRQRHTAESAVGMLE
ncbi:hypothetical protein [Bradyrhizobium sp. CSS354]|nr:hypothetical protein [Bradyrhizobium sp. CSS354]MDE5462242.1 hypothetical protein [Bradyrhizobium sp. CSS354]